MARVFDTIEPRLADWIGRQHVFFVGTAPAAGGHVNVSPKGPIGTLRILNGRRVAYLDFVGSGVETIAHLQENGRIVIMLCAFAGPPRIVRLHGRGRVVVPGSAEFDELAPTFGFPEREAGYRSVVVVDLERISDSCGYGVPLMRYEGERTQMDDWVAAQLRRSPDAMLAYQRAENAASVDGLPGVRV